MDAQHFAVDNLRGSQLVVGAYYRTFLTAAILR